MKRLIVALVLTVSVTAGLGGQSTAPSSGDAVHAAFDAILDVYVRDGLVYYNALRLERPRFDRYVSSLAEQTIPDAWSDQQRLAFWINAYNAFVLRTVIDHYPIRGRSATYPPNSIRQVPGAFERRTFRAAGRTLTLDQIEREVIAPLGDARALLALGRGALGSGRLRSEAYTAARLDEQLDAAAREVVDRREMVHVNAPANTVSVNPIFSWREAAFIATFADRANAQFASRSPLERAVLGLIAPHVVRSEGDFLDGNTFSMEFHDFDWRLNDLTGR